MHGKMDCAGLTDRGRVRDVNEDQFLIASLSKSMQVHSTSLGLDEQARLFGSSLGQLLVVADGMGGHAAGQRASALAVDSLTTYVLNTMHWFFRLSRDSEELFMADLGAALQHCQAALRDESERVPQRRGMGTTLTMAYLVWPRVFIVHAGDSRAYLLRGQRLRRITRDHTIAQRLAEQGAIDDPEGSPLSHVLWNVLGGGTDDLAPEVYRGDLAIGDTLLLCTDGLSKHLDEPTVARLLASGRSAEQTCRDLVEAANAAGGSDNVTVVVAHFRDARQEQAAGAARAEAAAPNGEHAAEAAPAPAGAKA